MFVNTFQVPEKWGHALHPVVGGIKGRDESLSFQPCTYVGLSPCLEPQNSISMDSIYSNFQPSLDHIDSKKKVRRVCMRGSPSPAMRFHLPLPRYHGRIFGKAKSCLWFVSPGDHPSPPCWKMHITWDGSRWGKRAKQQGRVFPFKILRLQTQRFPSALLCPWWPNYLVILIFKHHESKNNSVVNTYILI